MSDSGGALERLTSDEADALFTGLVEVLNDSAWEGRFERLLDEVQIAIELGNPSDEMMSLGRGSKRETVRRTVALTPRDRLDLLISAIEYGLVTPVDLAAATLDALISSGHPDLEMLFESDPAAALPQRLRKEEVVSEPVQDLPIDSGPVITTARVEAALTAVDPLRASIATIRAGL